MGLHLMLDALLQPLQLGLHLLKCRAVAGVAGVAAAAREASELLQQAPAALVLWAQHWQQLPCTPLHMHSKTCICSESGWGDMIF
jgi:hypothetical protein